MSNLLDALTAAAQSLDAHRAGLNVAGHNIANAMTPGYARRVVDIASVSSNTSNDVGGGARVIDVRALRDLSFERLLRQGLSTERRERAVAESLSIVEAAVGQPSNALDGRLTAFFNAFAKLADNSQSAVARTEVQAEGLALAAAFRSISGSLAAASRDSNMKIGAAVEETNALAEQVATVNQAIAARGVTDRSLDLLDHQSQLTRQLSELLDINVARRPDGGIDVTFGSGRPLVIGGTACPVNATAAPPSGFLTLSASGREASDDIRGGLLGGLLHVRDVLLPSYQEDVDGLASKVMAQVNSLHSGAFTQNGSTAGDFFVLSTTAAGASGTAATIALDSRIASDPDEIATGRTGDLGDNTVAKEISALRRSPVPDGAGPTLFDRWSQFIYRVGSDSRRAVEERRDQSAILLQREKLNDQTSGISLDEETILLLKYQRAYEATARFFTTINHTLDVLMGMVSR